MTIYKYRFDRILSYRESMEKEKRNQLNTSMRKYIEEKNILVNMNKDLESSYENVKESIEKGIKAEDLVKIAESQNYYREGIKSKTIDVKKADKNVKEKRIELISAMQDKKILERLKEIDFANYKYEEERKAEKELDEIIGFKYNSK